MRATKALASLRVCVVSTEHSLLVDMVSTEISCTGIYAAEFEAISKESEVIRRTRRNHLDETIL